MELGAQGKLVAYKHTHTQRARVKFGFSLEAMRMSLPFPSNRMTFPPNDALTQTIHKTHFLSLYTR